MSLLNRKCWRCSGQLKAEYDEFGPRVHCLNCGWDDPKVQSRPSPDRSTVMEIVCEPLTPAGKAVAL